MKKVSFEDYAKEYNLISKSYDKVFSHHMQKINFEFLDLLPKFSADAQNILDLGTGTGTNILKLASLYPKACFHALDISKDMLNQARMKIKKNYPDLAVEFANKEIEDISSVYSQEQFDIIVSSWSLFYVEDLERVFADVYRLLKKGGVFCILTNIKGSLANLVIPVYLTNFSNIFDYNLKFVNLNLKSKMYWCKKLLQNQFRIEKQQVGQSMIGLNNWSEVAKWVIESGTVAGYKSIVKTNNEKYKKILEFYLKIFNFHKNPCIHHKYLQAYMSK